jgi:hypothetical protein
VIASPNPNSKANLEFSRIESVAEIQQQTAMHLFFCEQNVGALSVIFCFNRPPNTKIFRASLSKK